MGYIETGDKTSVDVLTWVVLHSLITYERTREHFLCGQTAFLRVRLGKCHWIVLLNGSRLHQGPVSYILLQRGGRIPGFFCFFFFYQDLSLKGSLYVVSTPLYVDKLLMELCTADISCSRIARIRKLRRGGDVAKGVCLTYTDRHRNYDYMKAGISTNDRPNE